MTPTPPNRPGTPSDSLGAGRNPFGDGVESQNSQRAGTANPFASPDASRPVSSYGSSSALENRFDSAGQRYFHSRRVRPGEAEKPWLEKKDSKEKWATIFPLVGIFVGLAVAGFLVWDGISSVVKHKYCLKLEDTFSNGLDSSVWTKEVQVGGFG